MGRIPQVEPTWHISPNSAIYKDTVHPKRKSGESRLEISATRDMELYYIAEVIKRI